MNLKKLLAKFKRSRKSSSKAQSDQLTHPPSTTTLQPPSTATLHPPSTTTLHPPFTTALCSPSTTAVTATATTPTSSSTTHAYTVPNAAAEQSAKPTSSTSGTSPPINASPTRRLLDAFQVSMTILREAPLPGAKLAGYAVLELLRRIRVGHETAPAVRFY